MLWGLALFLIVFVVLLMVMDATFLNPMTPSLANTRTEPTPSISKGWRAGLSLNFIASDFCTKMVRPAHYGPLRVQRAFYPEDQSLCHVYILHPPGGVVAGDELRVDVNLEHDAHVLLTTPGANKLYRSDVGTAIVEQSFSVAAQASLEYFPQETIVFDGAKARLHTQIDLQEEASYIGWDILCFGRRRSDEVFRTGEIRSSLCVRISDKPVWIDKTDFTPHSNSNLDILLAPWGLGSMSVLGTLLATPIPDASNQVLLSSIRDFLAGVTGLETQPVVTVTIVDGLLVCRYMGECSQEAKNIFITVWRLLRPLLLKREAKLPRIWST
jgi:urease accessory protein